MNQTSYYTTVPSPIGDLLLTSDGTALTGLYTEAHSLPRRTDKKDSAPFREVARQLAAYFDGELRRFDLPLRLEGTEFQRTVWAALQQLQLGQRISYGELARRIGQPTARRAVGLANGRNPISIIVPCHRVIGASGSLVGYGGGLDRKRWLLEHEQNCTCPQRTLI